MKIDGACHCGQISYEADVDPDKVLICHCTDCQALSGTAFRTVLPIPESKFRLLSGTPKVYVKIGESGNRREQTFCGDCGSPLYAAPADLDGERVLNLRLGTARQRHDLVPKLQVWHRSALGWLPEISGMRSKDKQ
jgi:hypothetical protein